MAKSFHYVPLTSSRLLSLKARFLNHTQTFLRQYTWSREVIALLSLQLSSSHALSESHWRELENQKIAQCFLLTFDLNQKLIESTELTFDLNQSLLQFDLASVRSC